MAGKNDPVKLKNVIFMNIQYFTQIVPKNPQWKDCKYKITFVVYFFQTLEKEITYNSNHSSHYHHQQQHSETRLLFHVTVFNVDNRDSSYSVR